MGGPVSAGHKGWAWGQWNESLRSRANLPKVSRKRATRHVNRSDGHSLTAQRFVCFWRINDGKEKGLTVSCKPLIYLALT